MPSRAKQTRRKRKDVHFVFKSHGAGERYNHRAPRKKTKTVIFEAADGLSRETTSSAEFVSTISENSVQYRTMKKYLEEARRQGKNILAGETPTHPLEAIMLKGAISKLEKSEIAALDNPSLQNIRQFFLNRTRFHERRHELIRRTINEEIAAGNTPIEAQFGQTHSLLSRELRDEGIESSRELKEQQFTWQQIVTRKLMLKGKVKAPTQIEYKRGFVSMLLGGNAEFAEAITGKPFNKITARDLRFYHSVERALLDNLAEKDLDVLINGRHKLKEEHGYFILFRLNKLPAFASRTDLTKFLERNSSFWKRRMERRARESRRKTIKAKTRKFKQPKPRDNWDLGARLMDVINLKITTGQFHTETRKGWIANPKEIGRVRKAIIGKMDKVLLELINSTPLERRAEAIRIALGTIAGSKNVSTEPNLKLREKVSQEEFVSIAAREFWILEDLLEEGANHARSRCIELFLQLPKSERNKHFIYPYDPRTISGSFDRIIRSLSENPKQKPTEEVISEFLKAFNGSYLAIPRREAGLFLNGLAGFADFFEKPSKYRTSTYKSRNWANLSSAERQRLARIEKIPIKLRKQIAEALRKRVQVKRRPARRK